jgi:hypothetical protein
MTYFYSRFVVDKRSFGKLKKFPGTFVRKVAHLKSDARHITFTQYFLVHRSVMSPYSPFYLAHRSFIQSITGELSSYGSVNSGLRITGWDYEILRSAKFWDGRTGANCPNFLQCSFLRRWLCRKISICSWPIFLDWFNLPLEGRFRQHF